MKRYTIRYTEWLNERASHTFTASAQYLNNAKQSARNISARPEVPATVTIVRSNDGQVVAQYRNGQEVK